MRWFGPVLCLLAVVTLQVPWILCHSDCHSRAVPALGEHACHASGAHPGEAPAHCASCGCGGHQHVHHERGDAPIHDHEPNDGEHVVVQVPALCAGDPVELPVVLVAPALTLVLPALAAETPLTLHVAHALEEDPYPVPPASAVRLLL